MSSSNHNLPSADDRMPVYNNNNNNKRILETIPTIKKSISRNNMNNNFHVNHSPTTATRSFNNKNSTDQPQKHLTIETVVFPEHQSNLFQASNDNNILTKKSSSTPVMAPNSTNTVNHIS